MKDEVVRCLLLGLVSMQEHQYILLREAVIADAEVLAEAQRPLETLDGGVRTRHFDLIAACNDTYIRVLVLQAKDIPVIDPVEGRRIEGFLECKYCFHVHRRPGYRCRATGEARLVFCYKL